jgi:hypothetical protein
MVKTHELGNSDKRQLTLALWLPLLEPTNKMNGAQAPIATEIVARLYSDLLIVNNGQLESQKGFQAREGL